MIDGKETYACLHCGHVEKVNKTEKREDSEECSSRGHKHEAFHGYIIFHTCSKCKHMQIIDKNED